MFCSFPHGAAPCCGATGPYPLLQLFSYGDDSWPSDTVTVALVAATCWGNLPHVSRGVLQSTNPNCVNAANTEVTERLNLLRDARHAPQQPSYHLQNTDLQKADRAIRSPMFWAYM